MVKVQRETRNMSEDKRKVPFSKKALLDELRHLLLIEAARISLMRGAQATEAFIGFPYEADEYEENYPDSELKRINLDDFEFVDNFDMAYDYAFQCGNWMRFREMAEQRLRSVTHGIPILTVEGNQNPYYAENSKCRLVADMATARYFLAHYESGATIRELALLANMSEAAVRNSLSAENIKPEGKPAARVDNETALKWLKGRRGYIPYRNEAAQGENAEQRTLRIFENIPFQNAMFHAFSDVDLRYHGEGWAEAIAKEWGMEVKFIEKLIEEKPIIEIDNLCRVAEMLKLDKAKFAAFAVEAALRN